MIKKYTKKPVVSMEAIQFDGTNYDELAGFAPIYQRDLDGVVLMNTLKGDMQVCLFDVVTKNTQGECYPCKASVFKKVYDVVEEKDKK